MTKYGVWAAAAATMAMASGAAACPKAAVHTETARLVQMGAGGQSNAKAYEATISAPKTACTSTGASLTVNLDFKIDGALGPNVEAKPVKAPYFVVVMYDGKILAKEVFPVTLAFGPGAEKVSATETVDKISLPLRRNAKPDYEILVGFQLSPEQLRAAQK